MLRVLLMVCMNCTDFRADRPHGCGRAGRTSELGGQLHMCRPAELWRQSVEGRRCTMLCNACAFAERGHKGPPLYSGDVFDLHKSLR